MQGSQDVVEVMGNAAGQGADGFHLLRFEKLRFQLLSPGQVAHDSPDEFAIAEAHVAGADLDRKLGAIFAAMLALGAIVAAALQSLPDLLPARGCELLVEVPGIHLAYEFLARVSKLADAGLVCINDGSILGEPVDGIKHHVHRELGDAQCLFGLATFGGFALQVFCAFLHATG